MIDPKTAFVSSATKHKSRQPFLGKEKCKNEKKPCHDSYK
jgi:hypothetical protein